MKRMPRTLNLAVPRSPEDITVVVGGREFIINSEQIGQEIKLPPFPGDPGGSGEVIMVLDAQEAGSGTFPIERAVRGVSNRVDLDDLGRDLIEEALETDLVLIVTFTDE